MPESATE